MCTQQHERRCNLKVVTRRVRRANLTPLAEHDWIADLVAVVVRAMGDLVSPHVRNRLEGR